LSLHGDYIHLGSATDALCEFANEDQVSIELQMDNASNATWTFDASKELDYLGLIEAASKIDPKIFASPLFGRGFHYLGPERLGPRVVQSRDDIAVGDYKNVGVAGEFTAPFLALHGNKILVSDARSHKKAASNSLIQQAEAWMSEFTSEIRIQIQEYRGTDQFQITYSSELKSGTTSKYRATNVGYGLSFVLPVIVTLLAAEPGDLIIIDTPEAHLHPRGQFKIGELIACTAKAGVQVVIETHSDHVLNGVRLSVYDKLILTNANSFI
jgi:predicted ATPase